MIALQSSAIGVLAGRAVSWACLPCVLAYRAILSPLKGFRCAHGVCYGRGQSCSEVAVTALREMPIGEAFLALRAQLKACRNASITLSAEQLTPEMVEVVWRLADHHGLRIAACVPEMEPP